MIYNFILAAKYIAILGQLYRETKRKKTIRGLLQLFGKEMMLTLLG